MKRFLALSLLLLPASAWATTTVSGTLHNLGTIPVGQNAFVRFWLRGCSGNQPRVNGTPVIAPSSGGVFFFDLIANVSGYVTETIYSTRDSRGLLGGDIECGGSKTAVWYGMQIFVAGKGGPEIAVHARNGATLDLSNIAPLTTNPVVTAPTGDSTYCRLDGRNGTCNVATSANSFPGVPTGSCTPVQTAVNTLTGDFYSCVGGAWLKVGPGAAGTLSSPIVTPNPLGFNVDPHFKGPNPWVDVTTYGARSANPNVTPQVPGIKATMSGGSATAILSSASTFQNGDSVAIQAAGVSCTLATPTGVTVTPSVATGPTGTNLVAASPAGSTTRSYKVVARAANQCLSAASATATTTTGQTLGANTLGTISCTRANDVMTCTTPSPHTMVARSGSIAGTWLFQSGFTDPSFTGWWEVVTVPDNTHYMLGPGLAQDTRLGYAASATGGTVWWHNCDRIAWSVVTGAYEYAVYDVTGAPKLIGISKPQNVNFSNGTDLGYLILDNYGSPMMDGSGHKLPWFWPATPPSVSVPATLMAKIVSGAGTTTLTLSNAATTAVSGTTILFDNALNILTAANAAIASALPLLLPSGFSQFITNTYLALPNNLTIIQQGPIIANDTIQASLGKWNGWILPPSSITGTSFNFVAGTPITGTGRPLLYDPNMNGGSNWTGLAIQPYPGGWGLIQDNGFDTVITNTNFFTNPTADNDYMGIGLEFRGATNGSDAIINTALFSAASPQVNGSTSTPYLFLNQYGQIRMDNIEFNRRGIAMRAPTSATISGEIHYAHAQGEVTPFITAMQTIAGGNSGNLILSYLETDTSMMPLYAGSGPLLNVALIPTLIEGQSSDTAGVPPQTSGQKAATSNLILSNNTIGVNGTGEIGFLMPTPAAPTVAISGGSGPAANTYTYSIIAYDGFGGNTFAGAASAPITVNGSQGVLVSWTLLSGQVATTICRSIAGNFACGSVGGFKVGGTSFLDNGTFFANNSVPTSSTAISVGAGSVGVMPGSSTVASLPAAASGNAGLVRTVIDSTAVAVEGQTCVGGGTVTALAFSNGTVWKCF